MLMTAFLGMTTKMVEVTLSHKYREQTEDGTISGGPMYYMKHRLHMRWLAGLFAVATIFSSFGTGSLPQVNSISNAMFSAFGIQQYITGAVLSVLLGLIVIGGIKRIAQVTEKLVPFMAVVYLLGAFSILAYNYQHILPSFISVFSNIFTIVICSITGLVLLSSGTWLKKFENKFQQADTVVLSGAYHESDPDGKSAVSEHVLGNKPLPFYTGSLEVRNGQILNTDITLLHARSFADSVRVKEGKEVLFSGTLSVRDGRIELPMNKERAVYLTGKSLLHSAPLSTEAFKKGFLGDWGQFIIPFSLLLFAFSTTIAWSYYGDRAVTYLWGTKYVRIYHVIYIVGFFLASFTDTTIVWTLSGITVALMTLPNLIGILLLHKEVKSSVNEYWRRMKEKL
jgi:AGCS family alanine or glycine:cation symporter